MLIKSGAIIGCKGICPVSHLLHAACHYNHKEAAEILLQHGADVNATQTDLKTPLHNSATADGVESAKLMLQSSACLITKDQNKNNPIETALEYSAVNAFKTIATFQHINF